MYTMYKYILYVIIYHRRLIGQRGSSISGARGLSKNVLKKRHEDVKTRESYGTEMKYERRVLGKNGKKKKNLPMPVGFAPTINAKYFDRTDAKPNEKGFGRVFLLREDP